MTPNGEPLYSHAGTPFTYFANKEELLNELYVELKGKRPSDDGLKFGQFAGIVQTRSDLVAPEIGESLCRHPLRTLFFAPKPFVGAPESTYSSCQRDEFAKAVVHLQRAYA